MKRRLNSRVVNSARPDPDDHSSALERPKALYGHEQQSHAICSALERVRNSGRAEVVLVSGPAGVGKSSLVHELRKRHLPESGFFSWGKYDQFTRDIPYAPVTEALRGLVCQILRSDERSLSGWSSTFLELLGPNVQLMLALVPELELIVGEQPTTTDLSPHEAKARFHRAFRRFLRAFSSQHRPLVFFLDDVQWLDTATIDLVADMLLDSEVEDLLLVCAYRDDGMPADHPFMLAMESIRSAGVPVSEVPVAPLDVLNLTYLLVDVLSSDKTSVARLAGHLHAQTGGNPFFVLRVLKSLEFQGQLTFDKGQGGWQWDTERIGSDCKVDHVAELVVSDLLHLPRQTLQNMKILACLGCGASISTLAVVSSTSEPEVLTAMHDAVRAGLVLRVDETFSFAHDRVQEAVYHLMSRRKRAKMHLAIGRTLWSKLLPRQLQDRIFEVVDQIGRGLDLLSNQEEREQAAGLYLEAATRAKRSAAYSSALRYLEVGLSLLVHDRWEERYDLSFALELALAECQFLTGRASRAEDRLQKLSCRAASRTDQAAVVRVLSSIYVALGDQARAVEVGLGFLAAVGIELAAHPSEGDLRRSIEKSRMLLAGRPIESLVDLPLMVDKDWLAVMEVLAYMVLPALLTDSVLEDLVYAEMVNLSLVHGNCDASCYAYASFIVPLGLRFGDYASGRQFGDLALRLVDAHHFDRFKARTYTCYSCFVVPWTRHLPESISLARDAIELGMATGDLVYAAATAKSLVSSLLVSGVALDVVEAEAEQFLETARKANFGLAADAAIGQLLLIRDLRGPSGCDSQDLPDQETYRLRLKAAGATLILPLAWHWVHLIQERYLSGDYIAAVDAEEEASKVISATRSLIDFGEYHFYGALAHIAVCDAVPAEDRPHHVRSARARRRQVDEWAASCPENFGCRSKLIAAELARLEGKELQALRLYEEAARAAEQYGFVQVQAIAAQLAARLHRRLGLETSARAHFDIAKSCYLKWGASAKALQMDLAGMELATGMDPQSAGSVSELSQWDLAATVRMSQAISSELDPDRMKERLLTEAVAYSGALRGLLIDAQKTQIVAEVTDVDGVVSALLDRRDGRCFPNAVVGHVIRTLDPVVLSDACASELFSSDPYIQLGRTRSILCLPLVERDQLVGILYLENRLSRNLFEQRKVLVLRHLASQAAISMKNAELYRDAQENREIARRRAEELRLWYDMIPALVWNAEPDGTLLAFNKRWHEYTGMYGDVARNLEWARTIHPDDIDKVQRRWKRAIEEGEAGEVEARIMRFDGVPRSFLIRAMPVRDENGKILQWYGTNMDIDDLKKVEAAQDAMARATRLTALGELTASIAHEINQPLMAIVMNAATCVRWLSEGQFDVEEARLAADRIIRDAHHAGDVIKSIRALATKHPPSMEAVDVNSIIDNVIVLMRGELQRHRIGLDTDLAADLPPGAGDRVQLQQVVMNLILNAIEAMTSAPGRPCHLAIRTELSDWQIKVTVSDSGPGIDPSTADQIFDAFFTTKAAGLGMGLSICRSILEAHGGRVWATSNSPTGSIFCFTLKAVTPTAGSA